MSKLLTSYSQPQSIVITGELGEDIYDYDCKIIRILDDCDQSCELRIGKDTLTIPVDGCVAILTLDDFRKWYNDEEPNIEGVLIKNFIGDIRVGIDGYDADFTFDDFLLGQVPSSIYGEQPTVFIELPATNYLELYGKIDIDV